MTEEITGADQLNPKKGYGTVCSLNRTSLFFHKYHFTRLGEEEEGKES